MQKFTEQPPNMQKHAFLCQRSCKYLYLHLHVIEVYHGTVWPYCSRWGQCVGRELTAACVCVMYYLSRSVWCENQFCGLILPVVLFLLDTRFVCRNVSPMIRDSFMEGNLVLTDCWLTGIGKRRKNKAAHHSKKGCGFFFLRKLSNNVTNSNEKLENY